MRFRYFIIIFPGKRAGPFIRTWVPDPFSQGCIVPSLVEIGPVYCIYMYISYVCLLCGMWVCRLYARCVLFNALCQVWLKLVQWFWRRRWKCEKFTTTTTTPTTTTTTPTKITTTTDNGQILIRKVQLSLRLRWAKKFTRVYLFTLVSNFMYLKPDRIRRFILILMFNVTASGLI